MTNIGKTPIEFSRRTKVSMTSGSDHEVHIAANREECDALAARFGLDRLERLEADFAIARARNKGEIKVTGMLRADYTQRCVVSLDLFATALNHAIERRFAPEARLHRARATPKAKEIEIDPLADDPPDPYRDDQIDLGAMTAEELGLNIDPNPRKPDAEIDFDQTGEPSSKGGHGGDKPSPFAVLKTIKPDR